MISFQPSRTARFTVELQELTLGNVRILLDIHHMFHEKQRSHLLKNAIKTLTWHKGWEHCDFDDLTVQERLFIESLYISAISDEPNFSLGNGKLTDFLKVQEQFIHKDVQIGLLSDDTDTEDMWFIKPLTGLCAEIIEQRILAKNNPQRADWVIMAMAAQLFRKGKDTAEPDPKANPVGYGDYLEERAKTIENMPERAAMELVTLYFAGLERLQHFFALNFDEEGAVVCGEITDKGGEIVQSRARFRLSTCISILSERFFARN